MYMCGLLLVIVFAFKFLRLLLDTHREVSAQWYIPYRRPVCRLCPCLQLPHKLDMQVMVCLCDTKDMAQDSSYLGAMVLSKPCHMARLQPECCTQLTAA
jgi:hypothetical protein